MIHRAPFGSMERFVGVLIEHFAGHFPTWLSPEQVRILPISEKYNDYATTIETALKDAGVRVTSDQAGEKVGAKIRLAQLDKVSYMLVVGAKEEETQQVSVRHRQRGDLGACGLDKFLSDIVTEIKTRAL